MNRLSLAFSPCPNDTFIFDAMIHHRIDTEGLEFRVELEDIESLNQKALRGSVDICKVSYHAYLFLVRNYVMLNSGSALGFGNGPILISREPYSPQEIGKLSIAIPGEFTTAHLLFKIAFPDAVNKKTVVFSDIEKSVLDGTFDAGVIIHENRFTYEQKGLRKIMDLGEYWEQLAHSPIPLGGIAAKISLGYETISKLNRIMRRSVIYALGNPETAMPFVMKNAQEMDEEVIKKHIQLYVNDFTVDLGNEGRKAVQNLFGHAEKLNIRE